MWQIDEEGNCVLICGELDFMLEIYNIYRLGTEVMFEDR